MRELQQARGLCGGWAPKKHFPSTGGGGCPAPAPKLAVPIQAKGKLPPDVNPVEPVRQFDKLHLTLNAFTRKLSYFFLTVFILGTVS